MWEFVLFSTILVIVLIGTATLTLAINNLMYKDKDND